MKFLIISDLHTGKKAKAKDLCPYSDGIHKDDKLVSSFIDSVNLYIENNGKIDYIIIPGDLTNQSNLIEYNCASAFLEKLVVEFNIPLEHILFVPGNHDVDWSVFEGCTIYDEEKPLRSQHKYNTLLDKNHLLSKLISTDLINSPYIQIWEFENAIFIGYNSSWHDDSMKETHYGNIDLEQIAALRSKLDLLKENMKGKIKVFFAHHHLYQYPNPHPRWLDFSCMQNAQALVALLTEFSFNFIINGHRHVPYFCSTSINSSPPINILCAGSYSVEIPSDIAGSIGNLFHIVELHDIPKCKGCIITKAYDPTRSSWVESRENHGFENIDHFGNEMEYNKISDACELILKTIGHGSFITFDELVSEIPELEYLQNADKKKLRADMEDKLDLKCSLSVDNEIIFNKKRKTNG